MKRRAGVVTVACSWILVLVLVQSLDAGEQKPFCRPKELTALTQSLMEDSLTAFDEANGENLGTWPPGFPELEVQENPHWSKVQCSLLFMAQGLEKVLEDQRDNLNPEDVSLHKQLKSTISGVDLLSACIRAVLGGECPQTPGPPTMPRHAFERKQWSHTLLESSRTYLDWLQRHVKVQGSKVKGQKQVELIQELEGSGFLL